MSQLVVILGDHLSTKISSLANFNKETDKVLMSEVKEEATYVKHHKKKIAFVFSAMRHFSDELQSQGFATIYVKYDAADNRGCLFEQVKHTCTQHSFSSITIAHPGEYRLLEEVKTWQSKLNIAVNITPDNRFIATQAFFSDWADGRKQYRMEFFYREMRKQTNVLMDDKQPMGGKWNYDADNRKPFGKNPDIPSRTLLVPD